MYIFLWALVLTVGVNLLMFIPAYILKTDKLTDTSYSITFIAVTVLGFLRSERTGLHWVILALVLLWAVRLGIFLLIRIRKKGKDRRFDGIRDKFWPFLRFWVLQGVSVFIIILAALSGFAQKDTRLDLFSYIGAGVFLAGLLIEAIADAQKFRFSNNPQNKGRWIDEGIWRMNRHPNYLGEMMVWTGIYFIVGPSLSLSALLIALLSPLYIITLLLFVSGIPLLEKSAKQKWKDQREFRQYLSEVPVLIPKHSSIRRIFR